MEDRQRDDFIAALERHPAHPGGGAAGKFTHFIAGKADRLARAGDQQHVVACFQQSHPDQVISLSILHRVGMKDQDERDEYLRFAA